MPYAPQIVGGGKAAVAAGAHDVDRYTARQLGHPRRQLPQRDQHRAGHMPADVLELLAYIDDDRAVTMGGGERGLVNFTHLRNPFLIYPRGYLALTIALRSATASSPPISRGPPAAPPEPPRPFTRRGLAIGDGSDYRSAYP
jgi:hypothetical protein